MRNLILVLGSLVISNWAFAEAPPINFNFHDADITKVIEEYAKASGQKFIIDPLVKGQITIINKDPVKLGEAFNELSSAMAINSIGISTQDDKMLVKQARALQRDEIEVTTELPPMNPTRMVTWIINLKYASADEINKQLRILTSRDGELVPFTSTNQIFVSDWTPNLHRIAKIIKEIDTPAAKVAMNACAKNEKSMDMMMRKTKAKAPEKAQ